MMLNQSKKQGAIRTQQGGNQNATGGAIRTQQGGNQNATLNKPSFNQPSVNKPLLQNGVGENSTQPKVRHKLTLPPKLPEGLTAKSINEFIEYRLDLQKPITQNVLNSMLLESQRIATELGITADEVFTETVSAGWISFKADWIKNRLSTGSKRNQKNADTGDFNAISNRMSGLFGNNPQPINAEVIS